MFLSHSKVLNNIFSRRVFRLHDPTSERILVLRFTGRSPSAGRTESTCRHSMKRFTFSEPPFARVSGPPGVKT